MVAKRKTVKKTTKKAVKRVARKTTGAFLGISFGKSKYQKNREKFIKQTLKRKKQEKDPAKRNVMASGLKGLIRMNKEYTAREKAEKSGVKRKSMDW